MTPKLVILAGLAVSLSAADIKAPPWETPSTVIGRDLYRENCVVCHDIDKDQRHSRKFGPSLNHLFQKDKLPLSHAKASRENVMIKIKVGGPIMPALGKRLDDREINSVIDYIASK